MRKKLAVVIVLLVVMAAAYGIYRYNQKPASVESLQPAVQLNAEALVQAYATSEAEANNSYLGKTLQVSGTVSAVQPGVGVILKGGEQNVSCSFENSKGTTLPVVGEMITVRGICTGYLIDVELNRCIQVK